MSKTLIVISIICLVLVSGCITGGSYYNQLNDKIKEQNTSVEQQIDNLKDTANVVKEYVCPDGAIVSDAPLCSKQVESEKTCHKGYTNNYICSSVYSLRKYQNEDCSYEWIKWKHCGIFPCILSGGEVKCDYNNPDPAFENPQFCTISELESFEEGGFFTRRSFGHEYADTVSDRAKVNVPLLIQGSLDTSKGIAKNNTTLGVCHIKNEWIGIKIYKDNLEIFSGSTSTDDYGHWISEDFVPREIGYHKVVFNWWGGNADSEGLQSREFTFYVSE